MRPINTLEKNSLKYTLHLPGGITNKFYDTVSKQALKEIIHLQNSTQQEVT